MSDSAASAPRLPDFAVRADEGLVSRARRWNTGLVTGAVILLVGAVAGLVAMIATGFGSGFTYALAGLFVVLCLAVLWTSRSRTRMLRLLTGGDGVLRADEGGVHLPGLGEIAWDELVFICVTDHRERVRRQARIPVFGWAGRAAVNAGNGTILCELAVRDGESLRSRARDTAAASRVTLYPRWPDGHRRGVIPLLLDAVYDAHDVQAVVIVLFGVAKQRGIAHSLFAQLPPAMRWKGPYLDDVIAGGMPR
ncbi:hypothetical protein [Microbacterium sp. TNHR37B]|uniref:hypothetical protein n=1 Tax=Microbacterium sp. TNHR37B TaxID=1775956 RepID=UPI0007B19F97|nr:hypothetical protein [Microbacterium sp. TNHR37B]KZE91408.1 hypothetical protein AVP41_00950 [Microbacterium sp. TNHR37B]